METNHLSKDDIEGLNEPREHNVLSHMAQRLWGMKPTSRRRLTLHRALAFQTRVNWTGLIWVENECSLSMLMIMMNVAAIIIGFVIICFSRILSAVMRSATILRRVSLNSTWRSYRVSSGSMPVEREKPSSPTFNSSLKDVDWIFCHFAIFENFLFDTWLLHTAYSINFELLHT